MPTLLQSVFNTFYDYEVDIEKVTGHKFIQDYKGMFSGLTKKFGQVNWGNVDGAEVSKIAKDEWNNWLGKNMEAIGEGAKQLLANTGMMVGAAGSPAAGVVTALGGTAIDALLDTAASWVEVDLHPMLRGDWVVVDKTGQFHRRLWGAQYFTGDSDWQVDSEKGDAVQGAKEGVLSHAVGKNAHLGLCLGSTFTEITVLDVETGITQTIPRAYVKRVDEDHQEPLNENPILHRVKGSTEPAKTYDQLLKETNVRVGDFVSYHGETWEVANYSNENVMVTSNGVYEEVDWGDLKPALNDTTAQPVPPAGDLGGFVSDSQGFHTGEWVFAHYPDRAEWHLGVIQKCKGTKALVISADEEDIPTWYEAEHLNKWKMQPSTGLLGPFRIGVIEGDTYRIADNRPDLNFQGIIAVPDEEAGPLFQTKVVSAYQGAPLTETVSAGLLARVPVADKQDEAEAFRPGLKGGGGLSDPPKWSEVGGASWGDDSSSGSGRLRGYKKEPKDDTTLYLIGGAVCVAGVLFYVYK